MSPGGPLKQLREWLEEARETAQPEPWSTTFATATLDGRPSLRTVTLKEFDGEALVFTTARWTRKAREIDANPEAALLFHWPALGRQVHVGGAVVWDTGATADRLFAERDVAHQWQSVVSRQGEAIPDLAPLRERLAAVSGSPARPDDWGALRLTPRFVEFWSAAADRLHDRLLHARAPDGGWSQTRLSP